MLRNPWEVGETDAQPTPMAYVHTKVAVDHSGIARAKYNMTKSYFYNEITGSASTSEIFSMKQNNLVFSVRNQNRDQVPLVRAVLNGLEYRPEILSLINKIEDDSIRLDRDSKDKMIQEILMARIHPLGSIKGDGFTKTDDGTSDISHDMFTIESAGTIQVRIRNKALPIGAECEFKVPLRHEWKTSDEWSKDDGKLTLYVDPIEKQTEFEKLSQIFYRYNPYENVEMSAMIDNIIKASKKHLPASLKMVYAFNKLIKTISILSRQSAIASGVVKIRTTSIQKYNAFPAFKDSILDKMRVGGGVINNEAASLVGRNQMSDNFNVYYEDPIIPAQNPSIPYNVVEVPAYSPEKFSNLASLFKRGNESFFFGAKANRSRFLNSLDVLSITAFTSKVVPSSERSGRLSLSDDGSLVSDGHFSDFDDAMKTSITDIQFNYYRHLYNSLIHSFLPNTENEYYGFGFEKRGNDPFVNPKLWTQIQIVDTSSSDPDSFYNTSVPSLQTITNNFSLDYEKDMGRTYAAISEALPSFLQFVIMYFQERDHGYRMTVVDTADHGDKGTIYIRS